MADGQELAEDESKQNEWNTSLANWEVEFDASTNGRVLNAKKRFSVPQKLLVKQTAKLRGEMVQGVFWPKDVWKAFKGSDIPKNPDASPRNTGPVPRAGGGGARPRGQ